MFGRLVEHLASRGEDSALLTVDRRLSYRELADHVAASASDLGSRRRLVLLETRNDVDTLVNYLGALAGGHVVLPVPAGADHTNSRAGNNNGWHSHGRSPANPR